MIISIAIASQNKEYVERLSEGLQQYDDLSISVFTNADRLATAMEHSKFDIVLFEPDISAEKLNFPKVKLPVCLYSDEAVHSSMYADFLNVLKYQRISNIYKEVLKHYAEKAGYVAEMGSTQQTKLIAVYSPVGGSGKTVVSLSVAARLAEQGKNVLFLSFEQLNSTEAFFPYQEEGNTELVAALEGEAVFELKLRGIAKTGWNGVNYIEGFRRAVDYCDVAGEEMTNILKNIRKCGIYDFVVMDMWCGIDEISKAIITESDHVVVVNKTGMFASQKMGFFARQAIVTENQSKMVQVCNFAENNSHYNQEINVPQIGLVHNYGNLTEERLVQAINTNKEIDISVFL